GHQPLRLALAVHAKRPEGPLGCERHEDERVAGPVLRDVADAGRRAEAARKGSRGLRAREVLDQDVFLVGRSRREGQPGAVGRPDGLPLVGGVLGQRLETPRTASISQRSQLPSASETSTATRRPSGVSDSWPYRAGSPNVPTRLP